MWSSTLRDISLVIILLKAGLGLDSKKLAQLKLAVLKLSFVPCIVETFSISVLAHFILGLPWIWSIMLGFILSAVSAAVVVPGMLKMEDTQLGTQCGIPTLLLASVSVDNIIALTGFMVTYSILTSDESLIWSLIQRPIEPLIGFSLGAVIGLVLWYLPSPNSSKHGLVYYRSLLLVLGGLNFVFISKRCDVAGVGALGCVSLAYVASLKWKEDAAHFKSITWITSLMWSIIETFLFGLIGTEVAYESLGNNIGMSILTLLLGITVRSVATLVSLTRSNFNLKEKAFISASWISKATVQAAVGTQALDFARSHETDLEFVDYSQQILTMAVLSIVITAPLGAAFIDHLAPWLLKQHDIADDEEAAEEVSFFQQVTETNYGSTSSLIGQEKITV